MRVQVTEAGKWTLDAPQQVWRGENGKADSVLQSALFAGMAKQNAPEFAQRVLGRMLNMVSK